MKIVYIGLKELKADNVAGTGLTWKRGDVHEVADELKAKKLLEHPLIWANADGKYELAKEPAVVPPEPRIHVTPDKMASPFWDPFVMVVSADVFSRLQKKELVSVFMTPADADAFAEWKLDRDTRPVDTSPKDTGPIDKRTREYRQGLERKAS